MREIKKRLIPPDLKQCQTEILQGSFMTFGPRSYKRCENTPDVIASIRHKQGKMSLCISCKKTALKQLKNVVFVKLK